MTRRVCIESPLRGATDELVQRNVLYADACMHDSLRRLEAPFLGHLLYPRVLDDRDEDQRHIGIQAHLAWLDGSQLVAVYMDHGITDGMRLAIDRAVALEIPYEFRELGKGWLERAEAMAKTAGFFLRH